MASAGPIIDSDLLVAFAAFAEALNFTRAARHVGLSQPAFFERVQRLQTMLQVPLYQRAGRGLVLTEHGVRVAAHAREAQERGQAFLRELGGGAQAEEVALAAGEGSYLYLLGPALRAFAAAGGAAGGAPGGTRLRLLTVGANAACGALLCGEAHLAVCALDLVPPELSAAELLRTPMCAVMAAGHRLARHKTLTLAHLRGERLILAPPNQLHREHTVRALARAGCDLTDPIEADGWPLMLRFAELGLGVAFVNGLCVPRPLRDGAGAQGEPPPLVARPVPELGSISYRLLRRRGALLPAAAETLARLIVESTAG